MNDMRDQIELNEDVLRRVLPQTKRQERRVPTTSNHEGLENELEDEDEYSMVGEVLVTRRVLSTQLKENVVEQQHGNIFHTCYHVN